MMEENYLVGILTMPAALKLGMDRVFNLFFLGSKTSLISDLNYYARKVYTFARFFRVEK
jgi:hypothetical protein